MNRFLGILLVVLLVLGSCGPRPMYKTRAGKKKLKHYNQLQFGDPKREFKK